MKCIKIFDTTLRDGEQTPRVNLNAKEKLRIAKQLEALGVDIIEAGFAAASPGDFEAIELIAQNIKNSTVTSLARAVKSDIEMAAKAIKKANKARIHTFIATSPIHREFKLKMSKEEILKTVDEMVRYVRTFTNDIEFSAEDAMRTEKEYLVEVYETAIKAGATTINIPDTVGYRTPQEMYDTVKYLKENIKGIENIDISVHCHNDLGLAVANSIAAVQAGATQIECTINGIGERAGNTSLEEVVMLFKTRRDLFADFITNIDTKQIYPTSKLVSLLTGVTTQPNKAIVGANAFSHESGIHQHGVLANPETYEIIKPEVVGRNVDSLVLGKLSGKHAFVDKLNSLGFSGFDDKKIEELFANFKNLADKKKYVLDEDIISLISGDAAEVKGRFSLEHFEIIRTDIKAKAEIIMYVDGEKDVSSSYGSGPVDAAYKAINRLLNDNFVLEEYKLESITGDTDAQAQVVVIIEKDNKRHIGRAQSTDIVESSIKAYINALNRLYKED
ncbi:2-isopropylmalate synthase [Fusobacterium pseudoperiodonticum]|uniref:2-isopropylmalate synthase n=1 Tax=Fusobacterium pseudoperiodonticum TaxID=2663009 RepID=A0A2G9EFV2_9FUSO|nr:2-isopropylmalate synthase [Fusobacterium pseudoperiodonticum]PIM79762.1 2-isopropylmalate synthase [Fusobacterium pseudoperiodonticum]